MAAQTTIKIKRGNGPPSNGDLSQGELYMDLTNLVLWGSANGTTVIQLTGGAEGRIYQVLDRQTDNTLDPGASPNVGDSYIIEDSGDLHANFGTITGVENNDIVRYNGSAFVVLVNVSDTGEGPHAYIEDENKLYFFNGSAWAPVSGSGVDHGTLSGLGDDDHTQYALVTVSGSADPSGAPARAGAIYARTDTAKAWVAVGTSGSGDWLEVVTRTATQTLTNKTIADSGSTIDGGTL